MGLFDKTGNQNETGYPEWDTGETENVTPEAEDAGVEETIDTETETETDAEFETEAKDEKETPGVRPRKPRARNNKISRRQVTQILDVYQRVTDTTGETRSVLATLLDVDDTPETLTVEVMVGAKTATGMLQQLSSLAAMSEMDTALTLLGAGRAEMRPLWRLAQTLHGTGEQIPSQDIAAAKQLAGLLHTLPGDTVSALDTAREILT